MFDAIPLPMWVYDASTLRFLAVNDAAIRQYGYSREEFLSMDLTDIRPPEEVAGLLDHLADGDVGSPAPDVWRHRRKDGSLIDVEVTAGSLEFEGREAAIVVAHDVTERRQIRERLAEAERMEAIGRLAGGVAHDFNNLLTVIIRLHRDPVRRSWTSATGRERARRDRATRPTQAAALTRQLLAFSRRQVLSPAGASTSTRSWPACEPMLAAHHRRATCWSPCGSPRSCGRRGGPRAAGAGACSTSPPTPVTRCRTAGGSRSRPPTVELDDEYVAAHGDAGTPGPHALLAVSDTGLGMDEEIRGHLFEPFFTTKATGDGTGLGLATVFGVVNQSGGAIFVYSEEGRGTTFKIYFPAAGESVAADAVRATPVSSAQGRGETVVVVEDDDSVRELVRLMLSGHGYQW